MDVLTLVTEVSQNRKRWVYVDIKNKFKKKKRKKKPKSSIQSKHCITLHWLIYNYLSEPDRVCNSFWNPKVWHPSVHPSVTESCSGWGWRLSERKHEKLWNSGVWDSSVHWHRWENNGENQEKSMVKQPLQLCFVPRVISTGYSCF